MILWTNLKILDIMKVAVMVIVGLVVMQIMIIGEEIVSLVSSSEFWKSMSWSMGLILVPLINSSKQSYKLKVFHDVDYNDTSPSAVSRSYIAIERVELSGWLQKAEISVINDSPFTVDTYVAVQPLFMDQAKVGASPTGTDYSPAYQMVSSVFDEGHNTNITYSDVRPLFLHYKDGGETEQDEGQVRNYTIEYMKYLNAGEKFWHHVAAGADGTNTAGHLEFYVEYTFIVANFNNTKNNLPGNTRTFLIISGELLENSGGLTYAPLTGMRLYAMDLCIYDANDDTELYVGKRINSVKDISSSSVNEFHRTPNTPDLMTLSASMIDSTTTIGGGTYGLRRFYTKPLFLNRGDPLNFRVYNGDVKFTFVAQALMNYQEQGQMTISISKSGSNPKIEDMDIVLHWDMYITEIETDLIAQNDTVAIEQIEIFGIKNGEYYPSTETSTVGGQNIANDGIDYNNLIDRINIGVNADSLGQAISVALVNDYYQQGSRIYIDQQTSNFDALEGQITIHFKNARKMSTKHVLNYWNNDPVTYTLGV